MECCKQLLDSYPKEVYYQTYLCPHEIYKFDTHVYTKTGRTGVLLHAILGFEATPTLEICHRLISRVTDYRDVWIFLVLVREILNQDELFIPPRRGEMELMDFKEWCQLMDHAVTEKLRRFGIPQGAHMQLYVFTHWHEFTEVGKKIQDNCFTYEDVIKVYETWQDSGQKTNVLMGEGKGTFAEEFGNDGISDAEMNDAGELLDTPELSDQQLVELGEEMDKSPLFHFQFQPVGHPKKALNTVQKKRGTAQKKQLRPASQKDNIGEEITRGVADMARRVIEKTKSPNGKDLKENDRVMFNFSTKKFSHPLQSAKFTVAEIANDTTRFESCMQTLANQLNSNESFDATDEFQVDMTIITEPVAGGRTALSILGSAKYLHCQAGVPEGPCGREELQKFQEYQAPDCRLKVMSVRYPYSITYEGKVTAPLVLRLLLESNPDGGIGHYHGCTSYSGFLERSYFCDSSNRSFDNNEFRHHPCEGRRCKACKTIKCGPKHHQPTLHCTHCNRHFYDNPCMSLHREKGLCKSWIRCGICCQEFKPDKKEPHRCYRDASEYFEPPIKVWADFEAVLDEDGTHIPILIVAQTSESDEVYEFYGPECTGDFLAFLNELAYGPPEENRHWDDLREAIGIFHNLKGYDSVFLQEQMIKENRCFEFLIPNGTKNLCMKVGKISFKDSMCFLPMSLVSFSSTFGITELKKGFFPHKFHTPDNQNYIGPLPDAEFYDPDGMSEKKKKEFEAWYTEERSKNLPFDLKKELIAYCRSDVALLKAGCLKFIDEFKAIAKFDPIEKCNTIAQACNNSGYPAWCQTEEQKAHYVSQYKEKEGIDLDPSMIAKNPGRKATTKLMLNSFWGKFGQNCNKSKVHQSNHPAGLLELLDDPLQEVQEVRILYPELVEVVAKRDDQDPEKGRATNVFIAAFTTCQARLKLYESLEVLKERVLYYDTDSVVYK
ncbi:putative DNA polymerase [Stylophora pistillata]|uniref:DNA-directed DNA polymerase n=1 Tax=Stylophora pistillata TaxID=50429 RepID=A0A2B4RAZ3_STYPI|nr:putative DNA polymerase [Stylophora pistillata]